MAMKRIARLFCEKRLPGLLFLNVSAPTFVTLGRHRDRISALLAELSLPPGRVILELTETHPVFDACSLESAVSFFGEMGFGIALDDLGEGFSSLKRWSVLKPQFVKIDRHFIEGTHGDPMKKQFIASILDIAAVSGCRVIAEVVEQEKDYASLREIGVPIVQGFLFSRPATSPEHRLSTRAYRLISPGEPEGDGKMFCRRGCMELMDGFIVTREGKYLGMGKITELIKAVSDSQIFAARHANPLTLLPGNVPIDKNIALLLEQERPFVVVYWDLNDFKPYNDVYGYAAGDEVIKATGRIIESHSRRDRDFLGHIGGDDFVSLFLSEDWERRIENILKEYGARA